MDSIADFVILGAQKAGTTSLSAYLANHPHILLAEQKEVHFFDLNFDRGLNWYRQQFPDRKGQQGTLIGEATPYYLFHPCVPERLFTALPFAKLIVLLRDPVERAISHYYHEVRFGWESQPLEAAIAQESERLAGETEKLLTDQNYYSFNHQHYSYLTRGLYAQQLERWFRYFPRQQIGIFKAEDLYTSPASTVKQVLNFLGLPDHSLQEYRKFNEGIERTEIASDVHASLVKYFKLPNQQLEHDLNREFGWNT